MRSDSELRHHEPAGGLESDRFVVADAEAGKAVSGRRWVQSLEVEIGPLCDTFGCADEVPPPFVGVAGCGADDQPSGVVQQRFVAFAPSSRQSSRLRRANGT